MKLVLASTSSARRAMLTAAGVPFEVGVAAARDWLGLTGAPDVPWSIALLTAVLFLVPPVRMGLAALLVWLATAALTRLSSAGALAACAAAPLVALLAGRTDLALFAAGIAALVFGAMLLNTNDPELRERFGLATLGVLGANGALLLAVGLSRVGALAWTIGLGPAPWE